MALTAVQSSTTTKALAQVAQSKGTLEVDNAKVIVDYTTANMIRATRVALQEQEGPIHFYSDGSLKAIQGKPSCAFSSVYLTRKEEYYDCAVVGTTKNHPSSSTAELLGLLASIMSCPRNRTAIVHVDSLSHVHWFNAMVANRRTYRPKLTSRSRMKVEVAIWWELVYKAYLQQGQKVKVLWVKAHCGIKGNEVADRMANFAHQADYAPWRLTKYAHSGLEYPL